MAMKESGNPMTLTEFLAQQEKGLVFGTVTLDKNSPQSVRISPWDPWLGCLCESAFSIPQDNIESVKPTGNLVTCCKEGQLEVVEILFQDGKSISAGVLVGLINQIIKLATRTRRSAGKLRSQKFAGQCTCGFNPRVICDGEYYHQISDCYDSNYQPCGYDDQVIGMCGGGDHDDVGGDGGDGEMRRQMLHRNPSLRRP